MRPDFLNDLLPNFDADFKKTKLNCESYFHFLLNSDCKIASNSQFNILTAVENDVQEILINKTCSKQATFDVFVWDGDWKSLHSSKVESLFTVEENNQDQVRRYF